MIKNNKTKSSNMKKEEELTYLEEEYKTLSKKSKITRSNLLKLEDEIKTVRCRIDNLTKNIWDEKTKSLVGKYIAWEDEEQDYYYYFFHVVQSNKNNIIGEMISHWYYLSDGNKELAEINYKPHRCIALNDIDRKECLKKLKKGTLYKEITEEEFNLRKTTPIGNTEE